MKKIITAKIFVPLIVVIFLSSLYAVWYRGEKNEQDSQLNGDSFMNSNREESISVVKETKETDIFKIDKFKLNSADSRMFTAFAYSKDSQNGALGGVAVLDITNQSEPIVFWEIKSKNFLGDPARVKVRDLTNDGQPELVSSWTRSGAFDNIVRLYTFNGKEFVPLPIKDGHAEELNEFINTSYLDEVVDIDKDGISELVAIFQKNEQFFEEIYKWDPTKKEYYLWKETAEKVK